MTEEVKKEEQKEELPPIKIMDEADFLSEKFEPAFKELKKSLEEGVTTLEKAQVKTLIESIIARGEIKDKVFDTLFNSMTGSEGAQKASFDEVKKVMLRYCIDIGQIKTALQCALDNYKPEWKLTERKCKDFFNKELLSDVTLVNPYNQDTYRCHRVIVASGSRYFLELFSKYGPSELTTVKVPEPFNQAHELVQTDQVSIILKYIYHNQKFKHIKDDVTTENFYALYAQAYALGCENLIEDLQKFQRKNLLNEQTALSLYNDAAEHNDSILMRACSEFIVKNFEEILKDDTKIQELYKIKFGNFRDILGHDDLKLQDEEKLLKVVSDYIEAHQSANTENIHPAESTNPLIWDSLTQAEKNGRINAFQKAQDAKVKAKQQKVQNESLNFTFLEKEARIQYILDCCQREENEKIKQFSEINPLSEDEKVALFRCIRYSFISDETLMRSNLDPTFALAREFIVQGLGSKLGNQESEDLPKKKKIDRNPRNCNIIQQINDQHQHPQAPTTEQTLQMVQAQQQMKNSQMDWRLAEGIKEQKKTDNFLAQNPYNKANNNNSVFRGLSGAQSHNNLLAQTTGHWQQRMAAERMKAQAGPAMIPQGFQTMNAQAQNSAFFQNPQSSLQVPTSAAQENPAALYDSFARDTRLSGFATSKGPQAPQMAQTSVARPATSFEQPRNFNIEYNFDENGVMYFLGSQGRRRPWRNPHVLGQVQAFASSLGKGDLQNFVGRTVTNCRTDDEPFAFFGVDLGLDRSFVPTTYTLRNRNSTTHVLMSWNFEGSRDAKNWATLDSRVYLTNEPEMNETLGKEIREFSQRGGSMSFAVDPAIFESLGQEGFRYFRIVQTGKNSSGSDHLSLSGFELYGHVTGGKWP